MKNLILIILALIISACSSEEAGLVELRKLCEKDAGLTIYKTIEADGYYDASRKGGALRLLIPSGFGFTEFCNFEPNIASLFDEAACWRLTKVSRSTGECNERVDEMLNTSAGNSYPEYKKKSCISVKKIENPTAKYSYHSDLESWPAKNGVSEFIRSYALFKEENGEVLSKYISYSYNKMPRHTSPISCHSLDAKFSVSIKTDFVEKTIIPNREK